MDPFQVGLALGVVVGLLVGMVLRPKPTQVVVNTGDYVEEIQGEYVYDDYADPEETDLDREIRKSAQDRLDDDD